MSENTFGAYIKRHRLELRLTLRRFCEVIGQDPANYSRMERGIQPPPRDPFVLGRIGKALGFEKGDSRWREMERLAQISRGRIPNKVMEDTELANKLPAFFRTLEGETVDNAVLDELIAAIRREH